jgi:hypothetical protein
MFLQTMLHSFNQSYFLRDRGYWVEPEEQKAR